MPAGLLGNGPVPARPHVGLVVAEKVPRVANFQEGTLTALMELLGAAGLTHPDELRLHHILRRVTRTDVRSYADIYDYLEPGELLGEHVPEPWARLLQHASAEAFRS